MRIISSFTELLAQQDIQINVSVDSSLNVQVLGGEIQKTTSLKVCVALVYTETQEPITVAYNNVDPCGDGYDAWFDPESDDCEDVLYRGCNISDATLEYTEEMPLPEDRLKVDNRDIRRAVKRGMKSILNTLVKRTSKFSSTYVFLDSDVECIKLGSGFDGREYIRNFNSAKFL